MSLFEENKVQIKAQENHANPTNCVAFYNPKMKICRELVLCCLGAYTDDFDKKPTSHALCLDTFGATGITGLLWNRHFGHSTQITINDNSSEAVECIQQNCDLNGVMWRKGTSNNDSSDLNGTSSEGVEITHSDANVLMHQRQFHFIHLDPFGSTVTFLDAAFRNIYNNGVLVLTSTDITALYSICPRVLRRNYDAFSAKCDYAKEVAARIVLAAAARAAARCNKGFDVLYITGVEHFVQVAVRVRRGAQQADRSVAHLGTILHCSLCQQWRVKTPTLSVTDVSTGCECVKNSNVINDMGPLWCGSLFSRAFLQKMCRHANSLRLSENIQQLLLLLADEALCSSSPQLPIVSVASAKVATAAVKPKKAGSTHANDNSIANDDDNSNTKPEDCEEEGPSPDDDHDLAQPAAKKARVEEIEQEPMFYYDLHARRVKGANIPRTTKLVHRLRQLGHRASCTHFNAHAVRTSASPLVLCNVMMKS